MLRIEAAVVVVPQGADAQALCSAGTAITLTGDAHHLELANNGQTFRLHATDIFGNPSNWRLSIPGFRAVATLTYIFSSVRVIEPAGADPASLS